MVTLPYITSLDSGLPSRSPSCCGMSRASGSCRQNELVSASTSRNEFPYLMHSMRVYTWLPSFLMCSIPVELWLRRTCGEWVRRSHRAQGAKLQDSCRNTPLLCSPCTFASFPVWRDQAAAASCQECHPMTTLGGFPWENGSRDRGVHYRGGRSQSGLGQQSRLDHRNSALGTLAVW